MNQDPLFDDGFAAPDATGSRVAAASFPPGLHALGAQMPETLYLGTSSWSYPGWEGLVYSGHPTETQLAQHGLPAYASHPLFRSASLDRNFYAPLPVGEYQRYAAQAPDGFRFLVKAPSQITDAVKRGAGGVPTELNADFLNAQLATEEFVLPCIEGLGEKAGPLVFQFSPMPPELLADGPALVERLDTFLQALPPLPASEGMEAPFYALEFRDSSLVTPRMMKMLAARDARYCVALHSRMPAAVRQLQAVAATGPGPLVIRWSLNAKLKFTEAEARYKPFDELKDEDPATREALVEAMLDTLENDLPVWLIAGNNAEGCAPLTLHKLARGLAEVLPG
jgi:uncharacterized protein YecE (DUF72 family)